MKERYVDPTIEQNSEPAKGYTTHGSVRRGCGHIHRSLRAAMDCQDRDHQSCKSVGGYSDRILLAVINVRKRYGCECLDCRSLTDAEQTEVDGLDWDRREK